jgi:hypothetical protein
MNEETYDPQMRYTENETRGSLGGAAFSDFNFSTEGFCELVAAWADAKKEMGVTVKKDEKNYYKRGYATLDASLEKGIPLFAKHGIIFIQAPTEKSLINFMAHKAGGWLRFEYPLNLSKFKNHQEQGSALTYARRYCFQAMASLAPGDDDDGEHAMQRDQKDNEKEPAKKSASRRTKPRSKADEITADLDGQQPKDYQPKKVKQHTGVASILNVAEKVDMSAPLDPPAEDPPAEAPPPPEEPPADPFSGYEPTHQVKLYKRVIGSVKNEKDLENIKEQIKKQNFQGADREFLLHHFEMKENELSA